MEEKKSNWEWLKQGLKIGLILFAVLLLIGHGGKEKKPEVTEKQAPISYDNLQKIFLGINQNLTPESLEKFVLENKLPHTRNVWMSDQRIVTYRIANKQGDAMQRYGTEGDYVEVTFNEGDKKIRHWKYYNHGHFASALYEVGKGYGYHDNDMKREGKGTPTFSNYYGCPSGEDAIKRVMDHSRK